MTAKALSTRFQLPGFGLPLNFGTGENHNLFKNALNMTDLSGGYVQLPLTPLRELTMLHLMNQLTDKPKWHEKVFDDAIVSKWKSEALATEIEDVTERMVDWCIEELQYKAGIFKKTGAVSVYNGDVVKSDTAIPKSIQEELKNAAISLEHIPERQKDWHPGSDQKVLDLVHPSLFPLVYGRSRVLPNSLLGLHDCIKRCGEGQTIDVPTNEETYTVDSSQSFNSYSPYSKRFQWLPCEVDIGVEGNEVKITSYINNLHPEEHGDLYAIIEKIISYALPLWNLTLTPLKAQYLTYNRVPYHECVYDPDPENMPNTDGPQQGDDEDNEDYNERREAWISATRRVVLPEPGDFKPPSVPKHMNTQFFKAGTQELKPEKSVDLKRDYSDRGLQIIVKLANIHLTSEKSEYEGGTWHVEGQLNEHICATAIYYYDCVNITTSRIGFRQQSTTDVEVDYEQDHHDWLEAVFGCQQDGPAVQYVGTVDTPEGRLLTWPNILQHQVQPFKLADPSKPGHRKILALFLVDPNIRIISTANVPCQQREWWSQAIRAGKGVLSSLPAELQDNVFEGVEEFPISLEEAKALRLELMEERKNFVITHDETFQEYTFSLCEH